MDQDATWYRRRPRSRHIALDGDPAPPKKGNSTAAPHFSVHVYCGQTAGWIKMPLGTEVGLGPTNIVRWGPIHYSPLRKGHSSPQFSAYVHCGQTAESIQMPLNKEVGLGPGHSVLDGDPAPSPPKGHSPQFSVHVCCGQTAGWINMPPGTEVGLGPGHIVLDENPSHPPKGNSPQFSAHVCCGQTVAHSSYKCAMF